MICPVLEIKAVMLFDLRHLMNGSRHNGLRESSDVPVSLNGKALAYCVRV